MKKSRRRSNWRPPLGPAAAAIVDALREPREGRATVVERVLRTHACQLLGDREVSRIIRNAYGQIAPSPLLSEREAAVAERGYSLHDVRPLWNDNTDGPNLSSEIRD